MTMSKRKMQFIHLLSDFAYYFLSNLFKNTFLEITMLWYDCNQPKELIRYLKSTCCLCLIYFFPKNITVTVLDKNVTVLTLKEYMLA